MSEILGAMFKYLVAIIGVAAVVGTVYIVFGSNRAQAALSDLSQLQSNTQALYSGQPSFASVTNAVAIAANLAPSSMISGAALVNPWSGAVTINVNAANASNFDITEAAVPADACAKLIVSTPTAVGLKVNGVAAALPVDAGVATVACNTAANTLIFTFAK